MLSKHLEKLEKLNFYVRTQMDVAECYIPAINKQIKNISELEFTPAKALLGSIILDREYDRGPQDSGQYIQAALLIPDGIGACVWDSEDYVETHTGMPEIDYPLAKNLFVPFDDCELAVKGLLLSQAERLLDQLMGTLGVERHVLFPN
jgi:hypothetical protein